ncbi:hypothetical protein P5V15_015843 [Pogonomyrmex californicus]
MQPASVTRENARIARENMERRRGERVKGASKVVEQKAKFDVNDLVRVSRAKATFEKGYEARWSEEIFRVCRVLHENPACTNCTIYRVNTSMGFFMNKN